MTEITGHEIIAVSSNDEFVTRPPVDGIIAGVTVNYVVAAVATNQVVANTRHDGVSTRTTPHRAVAGAGGDVVAASIGVNGIAAAVALDIAVRAAAMKYFAACSPVHRSESAGWSAWRRSHYGINRRWRKKERIHTAESAADRFCQRARRPLRKLRLPIGVGYGSGNAFIGNVSHGGDLSLTVALKLIKILLKILETH